ncbi:hypothetical protein AX777_05810 [Sphingobium yanoikuyae]|uniref:Uncharacterized protein n=1 Tax=Sphingobium yanoikuyae TaxID=13690 RepID=A0A177JNE6_SPHYA|nr:hypothetical protein [Sphingobium yanoikuyae]OAH42752.1 hypothetical protein AX777_05810 [Sphingobium yanoikuyae]
MTDLKAIFEQKKLNNQANAIVIPKAFTDKFPDLSAKKAKSYFDRYLQAVMSMIVPKLPFLMEGDETYVSTHKLMNECRDFNYKNERFWVWNEFKDIFPLVIEQVKGSNLTRTTIGNEKNTKVTITNKRFIAMLLNERAPATVFEELFKNANLNEADVEPIEIDMENLQNYIENTQYALDKATATALRAKLEKSLYQAQLVYKVGEHTLAEAGVAFLPMMPSKSPFGRTYYKGLNIQNVTKEVRSAIIGPHFQYDMNAAVYAVKLAMLNEYHGGENNIINGLIGNRTREYLDNKTAIRNRLAKEVFTHVDITWDYKVRNIKNALTAIGFGAKASSGFWFDNNSVKGPALTEIIKDKVARETFLNDPFVVAFLSEQQEIEDDILAMLRANERYDEICEVIREANDTNGKVTKSLLMAYAYQQYETFLMDIAVGILAQYRISVKARIHDAFIVMQKVPAKVMDEIIAAWGNYSRHLTLDCDEIRGWIPAEFKKALDAQSEQLEQHKRHIAAEERRARLSLRHG